MVTGIFLWRLRMWISVTLTTFYLKNKILPFWRRRERWRKREGRNLEMMLDGKLKNTRIMKYKYWIRQLCRMQRASSLLLWCLPCMCTYTYKYIVCLHLHTHICLRPEISFFLFPLSPFLLELWGSSEEGHLSFEYTHTDTHIHIPT